MIGYQELFIIVPVFLFGVLVLGLIGYAIYHALTSPKKPKE